MNSALSICNLSKQYRLGVISHRTLIHDVQSWWARMKGVEDPNSPLEIHGGRRCYAGGSFWALDDVSLEIPEGEIVGIIGRNGAGKSTLLKILSRVTSPTCGEISIRGRIASLLEVGTGFHPELTGRENIYLNGAILGMRRHEVRAKFDEIVAFAEIEPFIDTPVKRYSSGMYVRLAFAVAAHLDPEILLLDEILAVGDFAFRNKCLGKMGEIGRSGRTILLVSHDMNQIRQLCQKAVLLDEGRVVEYGDAQKVTDRFVERLASVGSADNPRQRVESEILPVPGPKITRISLFNQQGSLTTSFCSRDRIVLDLSVRPFTGSTKPFAAVWFIHDSLGHQVAVGASYPMDQIMYPQDIDRLKCEIDPSSLIPGVYSLRIVFHIPHYESFDNWQDAISFEITDNDYHCAGYTYPGVWRAQQYVAHKWQSL